MIRFIINILEIFGICFLRFRPLPRIWCIWLVAVNLACLRFITQIEGQVVLGVTLLAVLIQAVVYTQRGFVRLLGAAHILWLPMFGWMALRLGLITLDPGLRVWLAVLLTTNIISLIIDVTDVMRFVRGERTPSYTWRRPAVQV